MEITNDLIRKFFENGCDPKEFEAVTQYLESHPDRAALYGLADWKAGEGGEVGEAIPDAVRAAALEAIKARLFSGREAGTPSELATALPEQAPPSNTLTLVTNRNRSIRRMSWGAVAASLLVAVCGWFWVGSRSGKSSAVAAARAGVPSGKGMAADTAAPKRAAWIAIANASEQPKTIVLPDGSRVKLYAHSSLRYTDSFGKARRDSWLDGEAAFAVAKDRAHPFTVYAGVLATTALGTSFEVKARAASGSIGVRLFTGKVVVRRAAPAGKRTKDVYLLPGQQLLYDNHSMLARVGRFGTPAPGETGTGTQEQPGLSFDNSPLKEVFDRLSLHYHTTIAYKPSDLAGMNFTGTVDTDSLPDFLRLLATMNNLDVREEQTGFVITRHH
ncbi:MAG TPA: FecR domain-containing protein [Puia sp.]|nr:FecR domain-containing protein [Puia sp.]